MLPNFIRLSVEGSWSLCSGILYVIVLPLLSGFEGFRFVDGHIWSTSCKNAFGIVVSSSTSSNSMSINITVLPSAILVLPRAQQLNNNSYSER